MECPNGCDEIIVREEVGHLFNFVAQMTCISKINYICFAPFTVKRLEP